MTILTDTKKLIIILSKQMKTLKTKYIITYRIKLYSHN